MSLEVFDRFIAGHKNTFDLFLIFIDNIVEVLEFREKLHAGRRPGSSKIEKESFEFIFASHCLNVLGLPLTVLQKEVSY